MTPEEVEGLISNEQGSLLRMYAGLAIGPVAVEVGSYRGKSAAFIASGLRADGMLYCVDPWQKSRRIREKQYQTDVNYSHFVNNIAACELSEKVVSVQGFSVEVASRWDKPVSLLYLDGGHDYDEVLADLDAWLPHMQDRGIVLFDDYSPRFPGIEQAVHERFRSVTLHNVGSYHESHLRWLAVAEVDKHGA